MHKLDDKTIDVCLAVIQKMIDDIGYNSDPGPFEKGATIAIREIHSKIEQLKNNKGVKVLVPLEEMQNKPVRSFAELDKIISEPIGAFKQIMKIIDSLRDEIENNYRNSIIDECIEEIKMFLKEPQHSILRDPMAPITVKNEITVLEELKNYSMRGTESSSKAL